MMVGDGMWTNGHSPVVTSTFEHLYVALEEDVNAYIVTTCAEHRKWLPSNNHLCGMAQMFLRGHYNAPLDIRIFPTQINLEKTRFPHSTPVFQSLR